MGLSATNVCRDSQEGANARPCASLISLAQAMECALPRHSANVHHRSPTDFTPEHHAARAWLRISGIAATKRVLPQQHAQATERVTATALALASKITRGDTGKHQDCSSTPSGIVTFATTDSRGLHALPPLQTAARAPTVFAKTMCAFVTGLSLKGSGHLQHARNAREMMSPGIGMAKSARNVPVASGGIIA